MPPPWRKRRTATEHATDILTRHITVTATEHAATQHITGTGTEHAAAGSQAINDAQADRADNSLNNLAEVGDKPAAGELSDYEQDRIASDTSGEAANGDGKRKSNTQETGHAWTAADGVTPKTGFPQRAPHLDEQIEEARNRLLVIAERASSSSSPAEARPA